MARIYVELTTKYFKCNLNTFEKSQNLKRNRLTLLNLLADFRLNYFFISLLISKIYYCELK